MGNSCSSKAGNFLKQSSRSVKPGTKNQGLYEGNSSAMAISSIESLIVGFNSVALIGARTRAYVHE